MRKLIVVLIVLSLLLVGCDEVLVPQTAPTPQTDEVLQTNEVPQTDEVSSPIVLHERPPEDMTWISPGKVQVSNFYPGARAEWSLLVHNGKDSIASFEVNYREPNYVDKDYAKAPVEARDWVIIADSTPIVMPKQTKEVLIVLDMPEGATAPLKWEFWISAMEATQTGTIHTELCSRWLIDMRE